jgi:hypothetical protein
MLLSRGLFFSSRFCISNKEYYYQIAPHGTDEREFAIAVSQHVNHVLLHPSLRDKDRSARHWPRQRRRSSRWIQCKSSAIASIEMQICWYLHVSVQVEDVAGMLSKSSSCQVGEQDVTHYHCLLPGSTQAALEPAICTLLRANLCMHEGGDEA